jgi:hypothetical protein
LKRLLNNRQTTRVLLLAVLVGASAGALAQEPAAADSLASDPLASDPLVTLPADTLATALPDSTPAGLAASRALARNQQNRSVSLNDPADLPFILNFDNSAKAGIRSDVRVNKYYGDFETTLGMAQGSRFSNTLSYSWDSFRQQDKTIETRGDKITYHAGNQLPVKLSANGSWDWSEDKTTNNAGFSNLSKRDLKMGNLRLNKSRMETGPLTTSLKTGVGVNDQKSLNKDQVNNFKEAFVDGGAQVGARVSEGLTVATRLYGKSVSGDRTLGGSSSPSSATGDTAGVGVYFDQGFTNGRLAITRSNFDKKFLDYKRNSTGQIDTVGLDEFDKVIGELETNDAVSIEMDHEIYVGRIGLRTQLSRDTDKQAYQSSGVGQKERLSDQAKFTMTFGTRNDTLALTYGYLWKWDDQRIKNATENRGKQYTKNRDLDLFYGRTLFRNTDLAAKIHHGLGQDIAQHVFNTNDKDRLRNDVSVEVERNWPGTFKARMLFAYRQSEELAINSTRSSNNNIKDSYEVSPSFVWPISSWLTMNQTYRVYIQYTDYLYSDLEEVNRKDDYNKRGNVNTIVVINPTDRLELAIRHDYNKRYTATRVLTDATGNSYYHTDQKQAINKIDFGAEFKIVPGVTLETATFRTRDFKETFGTTVRESEVYSGEIWIGARVNRKWGRENPLELSALVKKFNAFGPSVTEASSDFWEADIWLKWEF